MSINEIIPSLSNQNNNGRSIWSIGGGKGGTGKSFFSANLGIHLAQLGEKVVLIDADLGGPNLHNFLGMKEADIDLGHFFTNQVKNLKDTQIPTPYDRLNLIRGTENILFTANLNYFKKQKLIRHINSFKNNRIIIDIGTGSNLNSIDLFLLSRPGILVINPEPTSIENAYYFLKSCIIRLLKLYVKYYKIEELAQKISLQLENSTKSIYSFLNEVISYDKFHADLLYRTLKKFSPCLIINKARDERDYLLGESIVNVVQKYLVLNLNFLGVIPFDEKGHLSLKKLYPFMDSYNNSHVSTAIKSITKKLMENQAANQQRTG